MAKSWMDMVNDAKAEVTGVTPAEAHQSLLDDQEAILIEVRDAASVPEDQKAPGSIMISLGSLPMRADLEVREDLRDPRLQDRSRKVITT